MQIDYKRDLNHNYMIIRENGEPDAASYQIRMLQTNTISGILECRMHRMDNCTLFYYDVTSRQALNTLYDRQQVGHGLLKALFQQLLKVLEELSSYLLDPEGLILAPDTVYLTAEPIQFSFCYLPGEKHSVSNQMKELMEYFLPRLNHREPETVVLGYGLYKIVSDPECSLEQIRSLLSREAEVPVPGEPFAEEKQEAREEQEEMRKKAMESFFAEEEEEEKESVVWTAAVIVGGLVVVGLVLFLMYVTEVPASMYVILLAAAGVSVLMVSLWMRKKERAEEEEERLSFLEKEEEASRTSEEKPIHQSDKSMHQQAKPIHQPDTGPIQPVRSRSEEGSPFGKTAELPDAYRSRPETSVNQRPQRTEPDRKPENREEESGSIDHLLCQKTEPLFIQPRRGSFRLVPVSHPGLPDIVITREETTIGRLSSAADVAIPFPTVSRLHAKLHCAQGICLLTNLNSCNGTYVNEIQLEGDIPVKLEDGDEIAFADIKYQFLEK